MGTNQRAASNASLEQVAENPHILPNQEFDSVSDVEDVLEEERVRHDLFHDAVKHVLARRVQNADVVLNAEKEKVRYANVLTSQELKFLLDCEVLPQDVPYREEAVILNSKP